MCLNFLPLFLSYCWFQCHVVDGVLDYIIFFSLIDIYCLSDACGVEDEFCFCFLCKKKSVVTENVSSITSRWKLIYIV